MFYIKNKNRNTENLKHVYYEDKVLAALKKVAKMGNFMKCSDSWLVFRGVMIFLLSVKFKIKLVNKAELQESDLGKLLHRNLPIKFLNGEGKCNLENNMLLAHNGI